MISRPHLHTRQDLSNSTVSMILLCRGEVFCTNAVATDAFHAEFQKFMLEKNWNLTKCTVLISVHHIGKAFLQEPLLLKKKNMYLGMSHPKNVLQWGTKQTHLETTKWNIFWHVDPLLGGDHKTGHCTAAVARQRPANNSGGMVFSVWSVVRCYTQDCCSKVDAV